MYHISCIVYVSYIIYHISYYVAYHIFSKRKSRSEESLESLVFFRIEEDRIDKPWNNWIKAVTIDAESDEGKELLKFPPLDRNRKISNIQSALHGEEHKKSFDEWCLYKAQEQLVQHQKLKEAKNEKERQEIEARYVIYYIY